MNSQNWQQVISTLENTRILVMEYNTKIGRVQSAYIKRIEEDDFALIVDNQLAGQFESEQAAFYYWKTEFDCKPVEQIVEKPSFWARIFTRNKIT